MKENGLLLVNLGSPEEPTVPAVKHYLNEFLGDPNVITMPPALWQPILKGMILPFRSKSSAATYRHCWLPDGSPLIVNTANLTKRVQEYLPDWDVRMAMTYEHPAIDETLRAMKKECRHITVLSLFPHFTQSTTQSIIEQVRAVDPAIRVIDRFAMSPTIFRSWRPIFRRPGSRGNTIGSSSPTTGSQSRWSSTATPTRRKRNGRRPSCASSWRSMMNKSS